MAGLDLRDRHRVEPCLGSFQEFAPGWAPGFSSEIAKGTVTEEKRREEKRSSLLFHPCKKVRFSTHLVKIIFR
jgi:hypothetical protein